MNNETKLYYMKKGGEIAIVNSCDFVQDDEEETIYVTIDEKTYPVKRIDIPYIGVFYADCTNTYIYSLILVEKLTEWRDKKVIELIV